MSGQYVDSLPKACTMAAFISAKACERCDVMFVQSLRHAFDTNSSSLFWQNELGCYGVCCGSFFAFNALSLLIFLVHASLLMKGP